MFCSKCGSEVNGNDAFCSKCGASLKKSDIDIRIKVPDAINPDITKFLKRERLLQKIVITLLVIFVFVTANKDFFCIDAWLLGIKSFSYAELIEQIDSSNRMFDFIADIFDSQKPEEVEAMVILLKGAKYSMYIGIALYGITCILAFLKKESSAIKYAVGGFAFEVVFFAIVFMGFEGVLSEIVTSNFWLYLVLNICIPIVTGILLYNAGEERRVANVLDPYISKLESASMTTVNDGKWRCIECGKINEACIKICACGYRRY